MTVMLSSQGIGLITVVAVSGCSVMLLVLGRQKLQEAKKEENSAENSKEHGSLSCDDSLKPFSFRPDNGTTPVSWRINFDASHESQESSPKIPKSACRASRMASPEKGNSVKKVRFSDDVVEPSGNNAEYRRRQTLASRPGQVRCPYVHNYETMSSNCSEKERDCRMQTVGKGSMAPNRRALYNGIFHDRAQRALLF